MRQTATVEGGTATPHGASQRGEWVAALGSQWVHSPVHGLEECPRPGGHGASRRDMKAAGRISIRRLKGS